MKDERIDDADLSLRSGRDRKSVGSRASWRAERPPSGERAVLLVPGYNKTEEEANEALGVFRSFLAALTYEIDPEAVIVCSWPGDWEVPFVRGLAYPFVFGKVEASAQTLHEAIDKWFKSTLCPKELIIVAHSLGCRLVLEMLARMAAAGRPETLKRLKIVMMAAAVPVDMVMSKIGHAPAAPDVRAVLYSESDQILYWAFPPGQAAAERGWSREAAGLHGRPLQDAWTSRKQMPMFDHGDYWSEMQTAEAICGILGLTIKAGALRMTPLHVRKLLMQRQTPMVPPLPWR
jgi:pimeloyl-ACP methyl ester carboxylesterase